jgi:hypothetical protein
VAAAIRAAGHDAARPADLPRAATGAIEAFALQAVGFSVNYRQRAK